MQIKSFEDLQKIKEMGLKTLYPDKTKIVVSAATCGLASGAADLLETVTEEVKKNNLDAIVTQSGCIGFCQKEPIVEVLQPGRPKITYWGMDNEKVKQLVSSLTNGAGVPKEWVLGKTLEEELVVEDKTHKYPLKDVPSEMDQIPLLREIPFFKKQKKIVLRNCGIINPDRIEEYIARGGYSSLFKVLTKMKPEEVIDEIKKSGLRGRGGAGFSTGQKWRYCRETEGDIKYLICNADEGDPGAYMDRSILEGDPHSVLEGMIIGAYAIGCTEGFIYVRNEYPLAIVRLKIAIDQATQYGLLGDNILGSGFSFHIKIKRGAGSFVCGEETALIASIEGSVGEPRSRPPYPAVRGLWGKPTNINNVKTWNNVPVIIARGAKWYSSIGTEKSKGTMVFSLVGKITNTGLVEVPMGIKLKEMVNEIGGGVQEGKKFKAVQTGGPSGGCIPGELIDLEVDYDRLTEAGSMMGSGGMVVMDEDTCMVNVAKYFLTFTKDESCGKCTPCREGTKRMLEMLTLIEEGKGGKDDLVALEDLAKIIKDSSLCGLGKTAPNPVLTTLRYFREEFEQHVNQKKCDALVCKSLISSPCQYTCPINQDVPAYIGYIAKGEYDKAIEIIRVENPLPGMCGRVCPHECEDKCEAGKYGDPIAIRALKRFASDYELKKGIKPKKAQVKYKEKVAIVGSGPAGLAAGYYLTLKGYSCTIFEALPKVGGMLIAGIPEFRLPRNILKNDIEYIARTGVKIKTGKALGRDFTIDDLFAKGFKAVFLALGAHKPMELNIPGSDHPAVVHGVKLLRDLNLGKKVKLGKRVAVIGGGNVAVDSARSAVRLGCKEVFVLYRRSRQEMPALPEELAQMAEEQINIQFLTSPVKVVEENGKFKGVECLRMELGEPDESGRRRPVPIEGSNFFIECDNMILGIGQTPDLACIKEENLTTTKWETIEADLETLVTQKGGVFAGGDVVTGPKNVVTAINHGKRAAISIDQYLRGQKVVKEYSPIIPAVDVETIELTEEEVEKLARPVMPSITGKKRMRSFAEVEKGFDREMAVLESKRCLRCDKE